MAFPTPSLSAIDVFLPLMLHNLYLIVSFVSSALIPFCRKRSNGHVEVVVELYSWTHLFELARRLSARYTVVRRTRSL